MRGLAEGARITRRGDGLQHSRRVGKRKKGCTAYAIVKTARRDLAGQNSDMTSEIPPLAYVLHLQPNGKPEVLMWTFGGMMGYHGMNSAGVAHFANALGGGPRGQFAMPHYPVKRMMLECRTSGEVVELLQKVPLASNGNYVICDGSGILDVEATTAGPGVLTRQRRLPRPHQSFLCPRYAQERKFRPELEGLVPADRANQSLLAGRKGSVSVDDIKGFLRDHSGQAHQYLPS